MYIVALLFPCIDSLSSSIAGFTALCENYCSEARSKHDGTDQLTTTLNHYLSQIVQGKSSEYVVDEMLVFFVMVLQPF